jgi:hypothetical protein
VSLELYRTDRVQKTYTLDVKDENGAPVTITSIQVALLPMRTTPTAATVWVTKTVDTGNKVTLTYAAPDATAQAGDLLPPVGGSDLYFNDVNGTFRDATRDERVTVM